MLDLSCKVGYHLLISVLQTALNNNNNNNGYF